MTYGKFPPSLVGNSSLKGRRILPRWSENPPSLVGKPSLVGRQEPPSLVVLPRAILPQRSDNSSLKGRTVLALRPGRGGLREGKSSLEGRKSLPRRAWESSLKGRCRSAFLPRRSVDQDGGGSLEGEQSSLKGRIMRRSVRADPFGREPPISSLGGRTIGAVGRASLRGRTFVRPTGIGTRRLAPDSAHRASGIPDPGRSRLIWGRKVEDSGMRVACNDGPDGE